MTEAGERLDTTETDGCRRSRAVGVVASNARDATDLAMLLAMLGLSPAEARHPLRTEPVSPRVDRTIDRRFSRRLAADVAAELSPGR